jgi:hypothetical protein
VKAKPMKVEIELPEVHGYEYTGEYRPPNIGELFWDNQKVVQCSYSLTSEYPILRVKEKPKILLYQWLINHNNNNDEDVEDCGYRLIVATEDHIVSVCKEFGWTYKKFNPSPLWSLNGDTL